MISKKILLNVSGFLSMGLFIWNYIGNYRICDLFIKEGSTSNCPFALTDIGMNLLPIIPLFLLALITYKMRDEVYRAWLHFSYVWIPLTMFLILIAPEYGSAFLPIVKGTVAFFMSLLFLILSSIIITWKYIATRNNK